MKLSEWFRERRHDPTTHIALGDIRLTMGDQEEALEIVSRIEARLASARAIMQRFVDKVDSGRARSTETYAEMKQWMEDE